MRPWRALIDFLGMTLPALLLAALVTIVMADVIARNFFAMSIMWAQEMAVILLGATVWLGLSGAAMQGQLFGISLFVDRLPSRAAGYARLLADLLVLLIAAEVIRAAVAQISTARFTTFLTLGWPKWIMAAMLALGMGLVIVGRLLSLADRYRNQRP
ncbi:TRAP transporter small permease [Nitratireductor soli]|uniref:TRAP transporter small permease n=1 Tax=Nitratireductor soli TaxID=1670619 RepID=UPI00065DD437|nr:TRAP transporter small permease [Nitratireductor soli]